MANGVVYSNSGTELILIWTDISHGIKSLAAIYSDSFVVYMCVRCIFYVRMYLNWELRQEDEIVYAVRIIVLNYDGTYLLWFAWRCYFTVYWARCACVCVYVRVFVCVLTAFHLAFWQTTLYTVYNTVRTMPLTIGAVFFSLYFGFPKTFTCILFVHADDYEWQAHTPQSRSESYKTYNFNLIWPKKGKSGKQNFQRNANHTHTKYSMNFSSNSSKYKILHLLCTHTPAQTWWTHKYITAIVQYTKVRASDERMFCQSEMPSAKGTREIWMRIEYTGERKWNCIIRMSWSDPVCQRYCCMTELAVYGVIDKFHMFVVVFCFFCCCCCCCQCVFFSFTTIHSEFFMLFSQCNEYTQHKNCF